MGEVSERLASARPRNYVSRIPAIIHNLFAWQKLDLSYAVTGFMDRVETFVVRSKSEGSDFYFPNSVKAQLDKFLKLRRIPDTTGENLVKEVYHSGATREFLVRSLDPKNFSDKFSYKVKITNQVPERTNLQDRVRSFKSFQAYCGCSFTRLIHMKSPSSTHKMYYHDLSTESDVPTHLISSVACKHVLLGLDYSADYHGTTAWTDKDGDSYLGVSRHVAEQIAPVIRDIVLHKDQKEAKYRLNAEFREEAIKTFKPLIYLKSVRLN